MPSSNRNTLAVPASPWGLAWLLNNTGTQGNADLNLPWYNTSDYADLNALVTAAGAGPYVINVTAHVHVTANLTLGTGIHIRSQPNFDLEVNNAVTLTINSPEHVHASPRQRIVTLTGTGLVAFTKPGIVFPGWWGAVADGATDDITPIRAADAAASASGSILQFLAGVYAISATWVPTGANRVILGYGATLQTQSDITAVQLGSAGTAFTHSFVRGFKIFNVADVLVTSTTAGIYVYNTIGLTLEDIQVGWYDGGGGHNYAFARGIQYRGGISNWYNRLVRCYCRFNHVGLYGSGNDMHLDSCEFSGGQHGIVFGVLDANNDPDTTYDVVDGGCSPNVNLTNVIIDGQTGAGSYGLFVGHSGEFPTLVGGHFESINGTAIQVGFTSPTNKFSVRGGSIRGTYFASSVTLNIAIGGAWWGGNVDDCRAYDLVAALIDATSHSSASSSNIHIGENYVASVIVLTDPNNYVHHSLDWYPFIDAEHKVAAYPVVAGDRGKLFDNAAAVGSVTFTLPSIASSFGCVFGFTKAVAQTMLIAPNGANTIQGLAASEALELIDVGDTVWLEALGGGAVWHVRSMATQRAWRERGQVNHDFGGAAVAWVLTVAEASGVSFVLTNANGAASVQFPGVAGVGHSVKMFTIYNNSGFSQTVKVVGGAGSAVANGKRALFVLDSTDCQKIYEQP